MNRLPGQLYTHTYTHLLIILSMHNTRLSTVISYYKLQTTGNNQNMPGNKSRSQGQPYSHILIMPYKTRICK